MSYFTVITFIVTLAAAFGYINVRFLKLPNTIGLMFITIVFTLAVFALRSIYPTLLYAEKYIVSTIDFRTILLDIMLGFILFAGGLHTNFKQLRTQRWPIFVFATGGVLVSTILVGSFLYLLLQLTSLEVSLIQCLLFGALISPTDPIAVLGIMTKAGVPKNLETKIVGESLFNDGVGIVVFLTLFRIASFGQDKVQPLEVLKMFGAEVVGGIALGLFLGYLGYWLLKTINDYDVEVIITLAIVMAGTSVAHKLGVSAPLAMVTAGLFMGNDLVRQNAMSERTEKYVDKFWELMHILLNTILFVLIGMEILVLEYQTDYLVAGLMAIPVVLGARYTSLLLPVDFFKRRLNFVPHTALIMTWAGLRGGISIALALGLTHAMNRALFVVVTYVVVVFSILVQGLSVGKLIKRIVPKEEFQNT